jgi:hypothetical protein
MLVVLAVLMLGSLGFNAGAEWVVGTIVFIVVLLGGVVLYSWSQHGGEVATVYENGFTFKDARGEVRVRWEEVDGFWRHVIQQKVNGIKGATTHKYRVRLLDGREIVLGNHLEGPATLGSAVESGSAPAIYARSVAALRRGDSIECGPFVLRPEGIESSGKVVPWPDVESMDFVQGFARISIREAKRALTAPVASVKNCAVAYELVNRLAGAANG